MTLPTLPTTLALSLNDLVYYGFILLFVAGPWLAKTLKKYGAQQNSPRSTNPTKTTPVSPHAKSSARQRIEELLGQQPPVIQQRSARTEPSNLTMSQRTQRAQAQAAYQQRSKQLNQPLRPVGASQSLTASESRTLIQTDMNRNKKSLRERNTDRSLATPAKRVMQQLAPGASDPYVQGKHLSLRTINARRLRDAVVLKEILDRPLALREA